MVIGHWIEQTAIPSIPTENDTELASRLDAWMIPIPRTLAHRLTFEVISTLRISGG